MAAAQVRSQSPLVYPALHWRTSRTYRPVPTCASLTHIAVPSGSHRYLSGVGKLLRERMRPFCSVRGQTEHPECFAAVYGGLLSQVRDQRSVPLRQTAARSEYVLCQYQHN